MVERLDAATAGSVPLTTRCLLKSLRFLAVCAAVLAFGDIADAQCDGPFCPTAGGPVRRVWAARPGVIFAKPQPATASVAITMKATVPAPVATAVPKVEPFVAQGTVVGAPGDRLKARIQKEIDELTAIKAKTGKLTPEQWDRLLMLFELLVKLFLK